MTDFYSEVSKLRNCIENDIIDAMVQNGLKEFSFERPISVTNNEVAGEGKVYKLALDVNNDNGNNMLVILSTWGSDNYDADAEYFKAAVACHNDFGNGAHARSVASKGGVHAVFGGSLVGGASAGHVNPLA